MERRIITGILVGEALFPEKAGLLAEKYFQCPYCMLFTRAESFLVGVFALPEDHQWWLKYIEKDPEAILGLKTAAAFFTQDVRASSPYSRGEVNPVLEKAPCGSSCERCPLYQRECKGCPATHFVQ